MGFNSIEKESFIVMNDDRLCRIIGVNYENPIRKIVTGTDLITDKVYKENFYPCSVYVPYVFLITEYGVISCDPLTLLNNKGVERKDIKIKDNGVANKCFKLFKNGRNVLLTVIDITIDTKTEYRVIGVSEGLLTIFLL